VYIITQDISKWSAAPDGDLGRNGMPNFYQDVIWRDPRLDSASRIDDPALLEPIFRAIVDQIVIDARAQGLELGIYETFRSQDRQSELFRVGATRLQSVGVHHYGLACDLVKQINGEFTWKGDYSLLGRLAVDHGLIWGGDWGQPDKPHSFVDAVHIQRCALWRQPSLFSDSWYPDDMYIALSDVTHPLQAPTGAPGTSSSSISSLSRQLTPLSELIVPSNFMAGATTVSLPTRSIQMPNPTTEAGSGEAHIYRIPGTPGGDQTPLTENQDYLGIDAIAWYVNKQSSWFRDRTASGVLIITMNDGSEKYQTSLGTFELNNGQKMAPVFGTPVLPDRNYVGGSISTAATLTAIKKDTVLGGLINSAASAGLGIIAGMVHTASVTGPAQILTAAGGQLISGIQKALDDPSVKTEPLFDSGGIQLVLQAVDIKGSESYILMHRGAQLDDTKLTLGRIGALSVPFLNGQPLEDGAWLLLRLRRSQTYSGFRDWFTTAKQVRSDLSFLVLRVTNGALTKDAALKELVPSTGGASTVWDRFAALRGVITDDGVMSEAEAQSYVGKLAAAFTAAKEAINATPAGATPASHFDELLSGFDQSLSLGQPLSPDLGKTFLEEAKQLGETRGSILHQAAFGTENPILETMKSIGGGRPIS
jgi:D-alanyl-D-alanine carboxypeptidase